MATIRRELTAKKDGDGKAEFLLRFTIRRGLQWRLHTSLRILPELWDDEDKRIRFPRLDRSMINELRQLDETLKDIESLLIKCAKPMMSLYSLARSWRQRSRTSYVLR